MNKRQAQNLFDALSSLLSVPKTLKDAELQRQQQEQQRINNEYNQSMMQEGLRNIYGGKNLEIGNRAPEGSSEYDENINKYLIDKTGGVDKNIKDLYNKSGLTEKDIKENPDYINYLTEKTRIMQNPTAAANPDKYYMYPTQYPKPKDSNKFDKLLSEVQENVEKGEAIQNNPLELIKDNETYLAKEKLKQKGVLNRPELESVRPFLGTTRVREIETNIDQSEKAVNLAKKEKDDPVGFFMEAIELAGKWVPKSQEYSIDSEIRDNIIKRFNQLAGYTRVMSNEKRKESVIKTAADNLANNGYSKEEMANLLRVLK